MWYNVFLSCMSFTFLATTHSRSVSTSNSPIDVSSRKESVIAMTPTLHPITPVFHASCLPTPLYTTATITFSVFTILFALPPSHGSSLSPCQLAQSCRQQHECSVPSQERQLTLSTPTTRWSLSGHVPFQSPSSPSPLSVPEYLSPDRPPSPSTSSSHHDVDQRRSHCPISASHNSPVPHSPQSESGRATGRWPL